MIKHSMIYDKTHSMIYDKTHGMIYDKTHFHYILVADILLQHLFCPNCHHILFSRAHQYRFLLFHCRDSDCQPIVLLYHYIPSLLQSNRYDYNREIIMGGCASFLVILGHINPRLYRGGGSSSELRGRG